MAHVPEDLKNFRKSVGIYHAFPVIAAVVAVIVFLGSVFLTDSYLFSGIAAAIPTSLLLWKWSVAAKHVDHCPNCGSNFAQFTWSYPPNDCPKCGLMTRRI
jgi:hypothetical protein